MTCGGGGALVLGQRLWNMLLERRRDGKIKSDHIIEIILFIKHEKNIAQAVPLTYPQDQNDPKQIATKNVIYVVVNEELICLSLLFKRYVRLG